MKSAFGCLRREAPPTCARWIVIEKAQDSKTLKPPPSTVDPFLEARRWQ
jgi:hypothetical protein